jgi:FMN phosphatase YigB (HAD superfamily)
MLHVGNSARLDVAAARQVGMNALLFEPGKPTSEGVIGELSGLEALLESWPFEP